MLLDEASSRCNSSAAQSIVLRQLDPRFKPELCFTIGMVDVDVHPRFLAREEVEAIAAARKHRRTHETSGIPELGEKLAASDESTRRRRFDVARVMVFALIGSRSSRCQSDKAERLDFAPAFDPNEARRARESTSPPLRHTMGAIPSWGMSRIARSCAILRHRSRCDARAHLETETDVRSPLFDASSASRRM